MFFRQAGLLFANMEWFVIVAFLVGAICIIIEFLQPGFGIFGILGIIFSVAAVILRAVFRQPEDNAVMQLFQFILLQVLLYGSLLGILFLAQKKGWLKRGIFAVGAAVDPISRGTNDYTELVGKKGRSITVLRPAGKAEIEGKIYDVVSSDFLIEPNEEVTVVSTEGSEIRVEKANKEK